ncbi:hypothetical protein SLEP1_g14883 [Rubroshorea leprosula]|uniref:Uncharacterized protein n=1 Tax=Rubroshorea leprosula TaxID=152421 RepID=A0AAV5IKP1_9ROSI|nr:hypothetical protein SLEP1_g14883 [Rubroshorea leprosula]
MLAGYSPLIPHLPHFARLTVLAPQGGIRFYLKTLRPSNQPHLCNMQSDLPDALTCFFSLRTTAPIADRSKGHIHIQVQTTSL